MQTAFLCAAVVKPALRADGSSAPIPTVGEGTVSNAEVSFPDTLISLADAASQILLSNIGVPKYTCNGCFDIKYDFKKAIYVRMFAIMYFTKPQICGLIYV